MGKNKVSGTEASFCALLIICLLMFCNGASVFAQESSTGLGLKSKVSAEESQVEDPSPEKAEEAAEKRQTLEELLAIPFNQIKEEQEEDLVLSVLKGKHPTIKIEVVTVK